MRKNRPYNDWLYDSYRLNRRVKRIQEELSLIHEDLYDCASLIRGTGCGINTKELYVCACELSNICRKINFFCEIQNERIEAANEKHELRHELRKAKQQNNNIYNNAANKIIRALNMYVECT